MKYTIEELRLNAGKMAISTYIPGSDPIMGIICLSPNFDFHIAIGDYYCSVDEVIRIFCIDVTQTKLFKLLYVDKYGNLKL